MPWWSWVVLGILLLGAELIIVDAAFYLVFIGIASVITGFIVAAGLGMEPWVEWIIFAALALFAMVAFRRRLYAKLRGNLPGYEATPTGKTIRVETDLAPGDTCRQALRGVQVKTVRLQSHQ